MGNRWEGVSGVCMLAIGYLAAEMAKAEATSVKLSDGPRRATGSTRRTTLARTCADAQQSSLAVWRHG